MNQQSDIQPFALELQGAVDQDDRVCIDSPIGAQGSLANDLKLSNSLNYLESCFDQDKINSENVDNFNRLNEESKSTVLESKNDIYEDKTHDTNQNEQLLLSNEHNISKSLSNKKQNNVKKSHHLQSLINKIHQLQLTKHDIIMFILNILMILISLIVYQFLKRSPQRVLVDIEEILVMKRGNPFGGPGGEVLLDDAKMATLTFNDTITRVTASQSFDLTGQSLLLSLTFSYSNDKRGIEYGGIGRDERWDELNPLELNLGEHINEIIIYEDYRNITNPWRAGKLTYIIVGIDFKTDRDQKRLFGSKNGKLKKESPKNFFLAYAQGKAGGHIDSLRFTWYKYCLKNSSIIE